MAEGKATGVVFTDLDGTLLDHNTYDYGPARPALEALGRRGVVLVLCSSKTRAELLHWQAVLGIEGPLVSENGSGVFLRGMEVFADRFPDRVEGLPAMRFGTDYESLRRALILFRKRASGRIGVIGMRANRGSRPLGAVSPRQASAVLTFLPP